MVADALHEQAEVLLTAPQLVFHALASRRVAYERDHPEPARGVPLVVEADVDREFLAAPAPAEQRE